jgi:hypothetical protein
VRYQRAALGFGLTFAIATLFLFFATTPPKLYAMVTADTLSSGFLSLVVIGGLGLACAAAFVTRRGLAIRVSALAVIGAAVAVFALLVVPQCLQNPLDHLDPLLKSMWLGSIREAQSIAAEAAVEPSAIGGFYAVGLIGAAVCVMRIVRGQQALPHAILLGMIAVSWAVTAYQVRGMIFANFLAFVPLSALVADLRDLYRARQNDMRAAAAFVLSALASIPSVWTFAGVGVVEAGAAIAGTKNEIVDKNDACGIPGKLTPLAKLPAGRLLSTANPGSYILRFTPHSVLTANYHRNQRGMLEALKAEMASPAEAADMLRAEKVDYILLCEDDPQVTIIKARAPAGLFARLADGEIPEFVEPVDVGLDAKIKIFRVLR